MVTVPPVPHRRRTTKGSDLWYLRYYKLLAEGFVHKEAVEISTGRIGTPAMRRHRKARRGWYEDLIRKGWSKEEITDAVDAMYEEFGWSTYWAQFYPEEGEDFYPSWMPSEGR